MEPSVEVTVILLSLSVHFAGRGKAGQNLGLDREKEVWMASSEQIQWVRILLCPYPNYRTYKISSLMLVLGQKLKKDANLSP